jgi:hypothetical protein
VYNSPFLAEYPSAYTSPSPDLKTDFSDLKALKAVASQLGQ